MKKNFMRMAVMGIMLGVACQTVKAAYWTLSSSSGNWDTAGNWDNSNVPDTAAEVASLTNGLSSGPYTCRVDNVMYPSGLTVGSVLVRNRNQNGPSGAQYSKVLMASDLTMNIGDGGNPADFMILATAASFTNVTLNIPNATSINGAFQVNGSLNTYPWNADFKDSILNFSSSSTTGLYVTGASGEKVNNRYGGHMRLQRGSLTVTNAAGTCRTIVGALGGDAIPTNVVADWSTLSLKDAKLVTDGIQLASGRFLFDNGGASGDSTVYGDMVFGGSNMKGGIAELISGNLTVNGNLTGNSGAGSAVAAEAGPRLMLIVTGATMTVKGSVNWTGGGNTVNILKDPQYIDVYTGSLNIWGSMNLGLGYNSAWSYATDPFVTYFRIFGGTVVVSNTLALGSGNQKSPVRFEMSGGSLSVSNLVVGRNSASSIGGNPGYYLQTGGTNTVRSAIVLVTTNDNTSGMDPDWETKEFVVQANATLILKGNGILKGSGVGNWSSSLLVNDTLGVQQATNLVFLGTTKYDPAGTVTTNLAFGRDIGANMGGFTNAFVAGTWDFSAMPGDGSKHVRIMKAGNYTGTESNAVYVSRIQGLTPATVTNCLRSNARIFYNSTNCVALMNRQYDLTGGGALIPVATGSLKGSMFWMK